MRSTRYLLTMTGLIFVLTAVAGIAGAQVSIGSAVDNFSLPDTSGNVRTLDQLKGKNGTVIVFVSAECPVVRGYNDRINQAAADYASKGINFVGINSNSTESPAQVKAHAEEHYKFPVLIDKGNIFADKLGAMNTPEVFYLDAKNMLVYRGAIDNDRSGRNVTESYLRTAFDSALAGKPIAKSKTVAFGCTIKRVGE